MRRVPIGSISCLALGGAVLLAVGGASVDLDLPGSAGGARAVSGPSPAAGANRAAAPATSVDPAEARPVYVVRMVPRGFSPDPSMTSERVHAAVAGASAYWSEQTHGSVSFDVVSVSDWIHTGLGCGDPSALWGEAIEHVPEAAERGAHLVVVAPAAAGAEGGACDYGYGSLGTRESGGSTYVTALHPELLAHELGHNLGLGHAGALECTDTQDGRRDGGAWQDGCEVVDYDDLYDVMGYSGEGFGGGHLGAVGVDLLGADPDGIRRVSASTVGIRLLPLSRVGEGRRILRVDVPGEPVYYAEYRTASGRDAAISRGAWRPSTGLRILRADTDGDSLELDASPGGWRYDRSLPVGATFTSASGRIRITLTDQDDAGATVDVVVGRG